jgi:uncharacterized protein (DUF433 family)
VVLDDSVAGVGENVLLRDFPALTKDSIRAALQDAAELAKERLRSKR